MDKVHFTEIAKLGKSISLQEMKIGSETYFRITKLYKNDEGEWKPSNKGVSIPLTECSNLISYLEKFITKYHTTENTGEISSDITMLD